MEKDKKKKKATKKTQKPKPAVKDKKQQVMESLQSSMKFLMEEHHDFFEDDTILKRKKVNGLKKLITNNGKIQNPSDTVNKIFDKDDDSFKQDPFYLKIQNVFQGTSFSLLGIVPVKDQTGGLSKIHSQVKYK